MTSITTRFALDNGNHGRPLSPTVSKVAMYTTKNEIKFPFRLHQVLEEAEKEGFSHIIAWLPGGDGFRILDPIAFSNEIMPKYFSMSRYKSFQRQLSLYSFKRETEGSKRDAYCHPFFRRENRDLCVFVPREKKRRPKSKKSRRNSNKGSRKGHQRPLSSEEVRMMLNSPTVSPLPEDFASLHTNSVPRYYSEANSNSTTPSNTSHNSSSRFAEADRHSWRVQQTLQPVKQLSLHAQKNQKPVLQPLKELSHGRVSPFPIKQTSSGMNWMRDHEASLWNYVNGLVVNSSNSIEKENDLGRDASNFTTDEILAEIASTFSFNPDGTGRSFSFGNHSDNSNIGGINNTTFLTAPGVPERQSFSDCKTASDI